MGFAPSGTGEFAGIDFSKVKGTTESVFAQPQYVTERVALDPKLITERTVGAPKIIKENYVEPLRQKVVISPVINQSIERLIPDYRQEQDQVVSSQRVLDVRREVQNKPLEHTIDGDRIFTQTIVEPTVKKITEKLNVVEGG